MKKILLTLLSLLPTFYLLGQVQSHSNNPSIFNLKFRTNSSFKQITFHNPDSSNKVDGINYRTKFLLDSNPVLQSSAFGESNLYKSFYSSLTLHSTSNQEPLTMDFKSNLFIQEDQNMPSNRRLKYSSLWAFTSLNYLYADLLGVMDVNLLTQYQTGTVNGIAVTPEFLTGAAIYMQLPLANVFLPHVIKNDKALRWIQIVSGSIATLVQASTLFIGEPTPYYILFSAIEIGTTAYITLDAIKWKPGSKSKR